MKASEGEACFFGTNKITLKESTMTVKFQILQKYAK